MSNKIVIDWHAHAKVLKYTPKQVAEIEGHLGRKAIQADFEAMGIHPDDMTEVDGNVLTTAGLTRITSLITGGGGVAFSGPTGSNRAMVGVGTNSTTGAAGDTSVGSNSSGTSWWISADSGYPTVAAGVITTNATFNDNNSQFAWNDWGFAISTATPVAAFAIATATTTGILVNRKAQSLGTKGAGATWTLQATITLS